jgi:hypothetical protein
MSDSAVTAFRMKCRDMQPPGRRFIMLALCLQADDATWRCAQDIGYLVELTGQDESTAQRHLRGLEGDKWIGRERLRNADGSLAHYVTDLSLEKLSLSEDQQAKCLLAREANGGHGRAVDKEADRSHPPPGILPSPAGNSFSPAGELPAPVERSSFLPSSFFPSDEIRGFVERCLAVCGARVPEIGDNAATRRLVASLIKCLGTREAGGWLAVFDFELDVLPTIERKTRTKRGQPLLGFEMLTADIHDTRMGRTKLAGNPLLKPAADPARARMETLRKIIADIDAGTAMPLLLPPALRHRRGPDVDAAWAKLRQEQVDELARLEAEFGVTVQA